MKRILLTFLVLLSSILMGCFAGPTPPRMQYLLNIQFPSQHRIAGRYTLAVNSIESLEETQTTDFIYRITPVRYITDYYHYFLVSPSEQFTNITIAYLMRSGIFKFVGNSRSEFKQPDFVLNGKLIGFYADYQNSQNPQAVIVIRYTLVDYRSKKMVTSRSEVDGDTGQERKINVVKYLPQTRLVFDALITEKVPLQAKTSDALVNAWSQGTQKIMSVLVNKIRVAVD